MMPYAGDEISHMSALGFQLVQPGLDHVADADHADQLAVLELAATVIPAKAVAASLATLGRVYPVKPNPRAVNFDCVAVDHGCAPDDSRWRGRDNRGSCPRCALHCLDGL
jgi:hypothetical protein